MARCVECGCKHYVYTSTFVSVEMAVLRCAPDKTAPKDRSQVCRPDIWDLLWERSVVLSVGRDQVQERPDTSRTKVSDWTGGPFHPRFMNTIMAFCNNNYVF